MSWRFRKSFKVLPGIKLNVTRRGLSATLGAVPFSINVGPRGTYANVSIPGTGIWDRQRIGGPSTQPPNVDPHSTEPPDLLPVPTLPSFPAAPLREIHSASTELLTSESMDQLRRLLADAYTERDKLTNEISSAAIEANTYTGRYERWEHGFLLKRLFKHSFATRKDAAETALQSSKNCKNSFRLTTIATEITVDREQAEPYYRMRDTFAALSESQKVWNLLAEKTIDRVVERSSADTAVTRTVVSLSLSSCDLIQWEQKVPHLPNRTGGDMYIYPGFLLYRASKQAFALINSRDVSVRYVSTEFTETESVPPDSQIIRNTWAKCNKDGSPDRRFNNNYQIPVAQYGTILFSSRDGLDVRYISSNARSAEESVKASAAFHISFVGDSQPNENDNRQRGAEPKDSSPAIQKYKEAFERYKTASGAFTAAHERFSKVIQSVAEEHHDQSCQATFSAEEFTAYTASAEELIAAAKELEQKSAALVSGATRGTFRAAIETLETSFKGFLPEDEASIDGNRLLSFLGAVASFLNAQTGFFEANTAALEKRAKRRGASFH
jgi:hypothetical protein